MSQKVERIIIATSDRYEAGERTYIYSGRYGKPLPRPQPAIVVRETTIEDYCSEYDYPMEKIKGKRKYFYEVTTD